MRTKALLLGAFSIASIFNIELKGQYNIFPHLFLLGKIDTSKTEGAKHISNETKYKCIHDNSELSPAIFSQLGSAYCGPMTIDEADKLDDSVKNRIKVIATSISSRKRSNKDGTRKDAPDFLRKLILTANEIPPFMKNSQAMLDRTTFVKFDSKPNNRSEWNKATKEFKKHKESLVNFLLHSDINYNDLIAKSEEKAKEMEKESEYVFSYRKEGIFGCLVFGILILKEIGYFKNEDEIEGILKGFRRLLQRSSDIANRETLNYLQRYLLDFHTNFQDYVNLKNIPKEERGYQSSFISTKNRLEKYQWPISAKNLIQKKSIGLFDIKKYQRFTNKLSLILLKTSMN